MIPILASAARTTSNVATVVLPSELELARALIFLLDVTVAGSLVGDALDVYLQHSPDGTSWDDFVHFTQVLGNGGAKKIRATWVRDLWPSREVGPLQDGAMAVEVYHGPVTQPWRIKWVITDGGGTHSFTFSLAAEMTQH